MTSAIEAAFLPFFESLPHGNQTLYAVTCVLVVRRLAAELPWFPLCVRDLRVLRIEENNDLTPAIAGGR